MLDYYAARADEYDRVYLKPERQADLRAIARWLTGCLAGRRVLEVACGTGWWTQHFAPASQSVLGVDGAAETLRIARSRLPYEKVELLVGDAYRLPTEGRSFDAAFAGFWWSHVPLSRTAEFLDGLHAALEPGATVVLLDNRYVEGSSTPISETDAEGNTYQSRRLEDGSRHRVLKNFPTREAMEQAVAGAASEVRWREWDYFWALEYRVG